MTKKLDDITLEDLDGDITYPKGEFPEARASVTYSLTSPTGFGLLLTFRSGDERELLALMEKVETQLLNDGFAPEQRRYGGQKPQQEVVVGEKCPKCGQSLLKFKTKTGKTGIQCSTRRYDYETKTTSGCDYMVWDDDNKEEGASPSQKSVLVALDLWKEGMTKAEALKAITDNASK